MSLNKSANDDFLSGLLKRLTHRINRDMEHSLPCIVVSVDSRTRVTVKPLIVKVDEDGNILKRNQYVSLPVETIGAGDILLSFNISAGDLGWIESSDRDISIFLQNYSESKPGTRRMHSFSDAKFVPDIMHGFTIADEDSSAAVLQTSDGAVKIALDADEIRLNNNGVKITISDSEINIVNGDVSGNITDTAVTWTAPSGFTINGTTFDKNGDMTTANGAKSTDGDFITSTGVSLENHTHDVENIETGSSTVTSNDANATES